MNVHPAVMVRCPTVRNSDSEWCSMVRCAGYVTVSRLPLAGCAHSQTTPDNSAIPESTVDPITISPLTNQGRRDRLTMCRLKDHLLRFPLQSACWPGGKPSWKPALVCGVWQPAPRQGLGLQRRWPSHPPYCTVHARPCIQSYTAPCMQDRWASRWQAYQSTLHTVWNYAGPAGYTAVS